MKPRKTDYGTIILHWLMVAALGVAFFTGLRIATEAPDRAWINVIDFLLPQVSVWTLHIEGGDRAGRRVDRVHDLSGPRGPRSPRAAGQGRGCAASSDAGRRGSARSASLLTWIFFGTMVTLIISGGLLYFGVFAGYTR